MSCDCQLIIKENDDDDDDVTNAMGQFFLTYLKSLTPIFLFTLQLLWVHDDV